MNDKKVVVLVGKSRECARDMVSECGKWGGGGGGGLVFFFFFFFSKNADVILFGFSFFSLHLPTTRDHGLFFPLLPPFFFVGYF